MQVYFSPVVLQLHTPMRCIINISMEVGKVPEYIEKETALQIIDNYAKAVTEDGLVVVNAIKDIINIICPTASVKPVILGKWVEQKNVFVPMSRALVAREKALECSCCGAMYTHYTKYCGDCGAEMSGKIVKNYSDDVHFVESKVENKKEHSPIKKISWLEAEVEE